MIRRKSMIIITCMALFLFIGSIGIMIMLRHESNRKEERTTELSAIISYVDTSSVSGSIYAELSTETPKLTLYIPPYVTEHIDMSLVDSLVPQSIIKFRVGSEAAEPLSAGKPVLIYSLSTDEYSVFTLSEHNTYMSMYIKPMYITGVVVAGLSLCVLICCLFSIFYIKITASRN